MYLDYFYEPTDIEDELFLTEMPLRLLEKSIESQFNDPLEYRKKDYVQTFITQYDFSKDNMYEDDQYEIDKLHDDFIAYMLAIFNNYLGIGIENIEDKNEETQHELIHLSYRFFIKNIKKNFVTLITNYIDRNKGELLTLFEKKKDVTSLAFRIEIDNEDDICILSNLSEIIRYILSLDFTIEEFFDLCENDSRCLETEYTKSKFLDFTITGNFIPQYVKMIDENFKIELQSKVRNKILKKYPIRKKDQSIENEEKKQNEENNESEE